MADSTDRPTVSPEQDPAWWSKYLDRLEADIDALGGRIETLGRQVNRHIWWWPAYLAARVVLLVGVLYLLAGLLLRLSGSR